MDNSSSSSSSSSSPLVSDLVLIGGGHAQVHVIKMCGMEPLKQQLRNAGVRITLITDTILTPYSGMLPGYISGHYSWNDIHLDLNILCQFANIQLIHTKAIGIEQLTNNGPGIVLCHDGRPPIRYDVLSIDIGITPAGVPTSTTTPTTTSSPNGNGNGIVTAVKPISGFASKFNAIRDRLLHRDCKQRYTSNNPFRLVVVGGGAGGIELALAAQYNLQQIIMTGVDNNDNNDRSSNKKKKDAASLQVIIVTRGNSLVNSHNSKVQRIITRIVKERNIHIYFNSNVIGVTSYNNDNTQSRLVLQNENPSSSPIIVFDECLWCTSAGAASWLTTHTPFDTNKDGFITVRDTFQSTSHDNIFATGDCCDMIHHPRPKAGVFAVRAGPPLMNNLMSLVLKQQQQHSMKSYIPQSTFLGLLSTGDKYAIASKGPFAMEGTYLWKLKDDIDRKWMSMYQELPKMSLSSLLKEQQNVPPNVIAKGTDAMAAFAAASMRCGGCGAKVGATTVARVLDAVRARARERRIKKKKTDQIKNDDDNNNNQQQQQEDHIDYDDAAIIPLPTQGGGSMIQTIDFFRSFIGDPYIFGKIAAVHALSDCHAMGAKAQTALALAVVPYAAQESITEATLISMLSGASDALEDDGCSLVGGHTCEGSEQALGFSVTGIIGKDDVLLRKSGGNVGDKIILTKPLGTGALFAANMRGETYGPHVQEALMQMMQSNGRASEIVMKVCNTAACTDVTGFGLMGHLLEMLLANETSIGARLSLTQIPFLQGALEASQKQIYSSLQRDNYRSRRAVSNHVEAAKAHPITYPLLFDPQTAGGLLLFVPKEQADELCTQLQDEYPNTCIIGELTPFEGDIEDKGVCVIGSGSKTSGMRLEIQLS